MTVNHSVPQQSPDAKVHTAGCRQHRDGEGIACLEITLLSGVV